MTTSRVYADLKPVYCPSTLAERWLCSDEKIRQMCRNGEIKALRFGKLIRIPASEVARLECLDTLSQNTEGDTPSAFETERAAFESRLARQTGASPNLGLVKSGQSLQPQQATEF